MAEFPALPFWTDAYIGDTAHLTNEEHGVYLRLLMFAWRSPDCCLPDDDKRLSIMVGMTEKKWRDVRPVISAFWTISDGAWTQKRLTKERDYVRGKSKKNSAAAKARWDQKPLETNNNSDANAMPSHMPNVCQTDAPTPTPTPIEKTEPIGSVKKRRSPEVELPYGWVPNERNIKDAKDKGFSAKDIEDEADRFRNYHEAKQSRFRNWDAAWRTWVANAAKFRSSGGMAGKTATKGYGHGSSIASIVARRRSGGEV